MTVGHARCRPSVAAALLLGVAAALLLGIASSPLGESVVHRRRGSETTLFECVANVTRTYFDRRTVYLYFDDRRTDAEYAATVDAFAEAVQSPKVVVPYSSLTAEGRRRWRADDAFAFLADDHMYTQLMDVTRQSHFVAVWTRRESMNGIRRVFRDFWGRSKLVNVIGLVPVGGGGDDDDDDDGATAAAVNAYTYRPFSSYGCGKLGRPYLLDRWERGSFRAGGARLFSYGPKTGNMLGCPLRCVGNEHPPDTVLQYDRRADRWTTSGVGGKVLEIVARHMNFTPVITSPKGDMTEKYSWYDSARVLDNITATLNADGADLAFGWYSYAMHREYNMTLAKTTSVDCLGWAVPYRAGPSPRSWTNYVNEFDRPGWLLFGSMFVVVVGQCTTLWTLDKQTYPLLI